MSAQPPDGYSLLPVSSFFLPEPSFFSPLLSCFPPGLSLVAEESVDDPVAPLAVGPFSPFLSQFETFEESVVFSFGAPRTSP